VWSPADRAWITAADHVDVDLRLSGANAARFGAQKAEVMVFVNQQRVAAVPAVNGPMTISLTVPSDRPESVVAINWITDHGPVAVTAFKLRRRVNV
jgi:hypothetical protein